MECGSSSGASGALGIQGNMALNVIASGAQTPQAQPVDSAARSAAMQAQGKGQSVDKVC